MTSLQKQMVIAIAESEYSTLNGDIPETNDEIGWIWADCIISDAQDKGCFASLVNAGLAVHSGDKGRDACVELTEKGFKEYKALNRK